MDTSRHSNRSDRSERQKRRDQTARSDFNYWMNEMNSSYNRHFAPNATLIVTILVVTFLLHMVSDNTTLFQELSTLITGKRPHGFTIEQHNWWNDYLYHLSLCIIAPLTGLILYIYFSAISAANAKKARSNAAKQAAAAMRQSRMEGKAIFEEVQRSTEPRVVVRRERRSTSKRSASKGAAQKRSVSKSRQTTAEQRKRTSSKSGATRQRTPSASKKTKTQQKKQQQDPLMVRRIRDVSYSPIHQE